MSYGPMGKSTGGLMIEDKRGSISNKIIKYESYQLFQKEGNILSIDLGNDG